MEEMLDNLGVHQLFDYYGLIQFTSIPFDIILQSFNDIKLILKTDDDSATIKHKIALVVEYV